MTLIIAAQCHLRKGTYGSRRFLEFWHTLLDRHLVPIARLIVLSHVVPPVTVVAIVTHVTAASSAGHVPVTVSPVAAIAIPIAWSVEGKKLHFG